MAALDILHLAAFKLIANHHIVQHGLINRELVTDPTIAGCARLYDS